jgi:hypothetical protein
LVPDASGSYYFGARKLLAAETEAGAVA